MFSLTSQFHGHYDWLATNVTANRDLCRPHFRLKTENVGVPCVILSCSMIGYWRDLHFDYEVRVISSSQAMHYMQHTVKLLLNAGLK